MGCMFGGRGMDVLALCETKMKGKGEVAFGEVTGRVSGVERGRAREGVALLLSEWMENKVVDGVKRALNDRRMDIREATERARNRNEWRMIVTQF